MWQKVFQDQVDYYRSQHRTTGCKITHLIGVPLIALSLPSLLFSARIATRLFVAGWVLQFIGHYVFEKNKPVLFQEYGNPMVIAAALVILVENWGKVLRGDSLSSRPEISGNGSSGAIKKMRADY
jgi:uncharacterized membrane protein YGL010W